MLDEDIFWTEAEDVESVTEEALLATRSLVSAVAYNVPVSKKGYVEPRRSLVGEVQSKRRDCKATMRQ